MATDKFTYDIYSDVDCSGLYLSDVWCAHIKLRTTGERVCKTRWYTSENDAVEAALNWMDDNVDNEGV